MQESIKNNVVLLVVVGFWCNMKQNI